MTDDPGPLRWTLFYGLKWVAFGLIVIYAGGDEMLAILRAFRFPV